MENQFVFRSGKYMGYNLNYLKKEDKYYLQKYICDNKFRFSDDIIKLLKNKHDYLKTLW